MFCASGSFALKGCRQIGHSVIESRMGFAAVEHLNQMFS
jgi:hypothetical protein